MINTKVLLDSIEKVKAFSAVMATENVDGDLIEGVHILDAKSIMGIFSLNLKEPIQLRIYSDDESILVKLKDFILEEN